MAGDDIRAIVAGLELDASAASVARAVAKLFEETKTPILDHKDIADHLVRARETADRLSKV